MRCRYTYLKPDNCDRDSTHKTMADEKSEPCPVAEKSDRPMDNGAEVFVTKPDKRSSGGEHGESTQHSIANIILIFISCVLTGIVFGFAAEKGRVFQPLAIRYQMVFRCWIMLKMFLSAMAAGMVCLGVISLLPVPFLRRQFELSYDSYKDLMLQKPVAATIVGCFILGIGMTLSGACPGMVLPQVGAWTTNSIFTLIGALIGALVYGLIHDKVYSEIFTKKLIPPATVMELLPSQVRYALVAIPMGIFVFIVVILLEIFIPWKEEVMNIGVTGAFTSDPFTTKAWPPSVAGVLIGVLQISTVCLVGDTLGGSSAYCTVMAQMFFFKKCQSMFPYMTNRRLGVANWWQVFYVVGAVLGGLFSSLLSNTTGDTAGVPVHYALIGGFFIVFGARLASGCTSGHGLSGTGMLFLSSFVAVPAMFAGGIATGFILQAARDLNRLV